MYSYYLEVSVIHILNMTVLFTADVSGIIVNSSNMLVNGVMKVR